MFVSASRAAKTNAYSSAGWAPAKKSRKCSTSESNSNGPLRKAKKASPPEPKSTTISIDDDSGDDQSQKSGSPINRSSAPKPSRNRAVEDSSESSTDDDKDDGSDLGESQEETDLMHLDKEDIREKLSSERPQWKAHPQRHADDEGLEDEDEFFAGHEQGTTVSKFDGTLEVDAHEEETMDVDDDELESEPERQSKKRARLAEVPRWTKDADSTAAASDPEDDSDCTSGPISVHRVNINWPEEAHYTPVAPGARNLSIKDQPLPMRRMIRASVNHVTGHFLFESAYPAANQAEYETFHRDVFVHCAKRLGYREINKRLKEDYELVKLCARVGRFGSTIVEGPKKDEMELPIAMVCVIATSTHASLDDWSQGYKRVKSDFRADAYESIYRGHEIFLTTLKAERPDFFHKLMSGLYDAVGSQGIHSANHIATRCMARLNLPPLDD
ncbi:hypothetical protein HYPSUDRAFT_209477 [Hypholoma sublateritium FD-334 SS-4]|uniref:DUF6532 domain-containing protein n=1 Tax=Hypholoma sublateritium (strain FD-334 SS-4) TaxID=945553 RepID=A0A0D2LRP7_HYPSF|nr:hypothetical protein HYPSUDRAFT_209842 [Hypholoma sublateritium FD-334 SS-4]KJA13503.1 hypothetical protein HYPSUDRAFT_209477 [Hypholoma sublateritium FD-334 SS-4]